MMVANFWIPHISRQQSFPCVSDYEADIIIIIIIKSKVLPITGH